MKSNPEVEKFRNELQALYAKHNLKGFLIIMDPTPGSAAAHFACAGMGMGAALDAINSVRPALIQNLQLHDKPRGTA